MAKLFLLRHLKSQWNLENRFSGWTDVPLAKGWERKAKQVSKEIFKNKIDVVYSSPLIRNQDSVLAVFEYAGKHPIFISRDGGKTQRWGDYFGGPKNFTPAYITWRLNERHYGSLEGLNKKEMMEKYGKEKVHLWRRSYKVKPPGRGECLRDVSRRTIPFYKKYVETDLKKGKNVLIVSSHNPLRVLVKHIESISDNNIINIEIGYGFLLKYDIDKRGLPKKKLFDKIRT